MKFSSRTVEVLRNFATINQSIVIKPGNTISTISHLGTILATATVADEFAEVFGIYDLPQFLGVINQFNEPDYEVTKDIILVKEGRRHTNYRLADQSLIKQPPKKQIVEPDYEVSFKMTKDSLKQVFNMLSTIGVENIAFTGNGEDLQVEALNVKNSASSNYFEVIGETPHTFKIVFKSENIKVLPGDYEVFLSSTGLAKFVGEDIVYFIAIEKEPSSFKA